MPSLRELQIALIGAILDDGTACPPATIRETGIAATRRVAVYANNAFENHAQSLRLGFPVVRRLVGDAYFDDCVRGYRRRRPSRSGDLHDTGARFAAYLAERHRRGAHRYLGDVARFERICERARCARAAAPLDLARLAAVSPRDQHRLRFRLHPSAHAFVSRYPVLAIWRANLDPAALPEPIDLDRGGDRLLVACAADGLEFHALQAAELAFLRALRRRTPLDAAIAAALAVNAAFDAGAALRRFVGAGAIVDFSTARPRRTAPRTRRRVAPHRDSR